MRCPLSCLMVPWLKPHDPVSFLRRLFSRLIQLFRTQLLPFPGRWFFSVGLAGEGPGVDQPRQAQRKALRRALLIGINDIRPRVPVEDTSGMIGGNGSPRVANSEIIDGQNSFMGPQRDAWELRKLLIEVYGYEKEEITVLIDDNCPKHVQPTRDNIVQSMKNLIQDAAGGDQFFFHFSGNWPQKTRDLWVEEDGKDELILTCDGQVIVDDELSEHLVKPLPARSTLVVILDSCKSGILFDLPHFHCNRVYVPWWNQRKQRRAVTNFVQPLAEVSWNHFQSPQPMYCTGWCWDQPPVACISKQPIEAEVIALSWAKDDLMQWEEVPHMSMTQALIYILRQNHEPSLENLLKLVSHRLYNFQEKFSEGINRFQDPQISSVKPLDLQLRWKI